MSVVDLPLKTRLDPSFLMMYMLSGWIFKLHVHNKYNTNTNLLSQYVEFLGHLIELN